MTQYQGEKCDMLTLHKVLIVLFSVMCIYDYFNITIPVIVRVENPQFSLLGPYNTTEHTFNDAYEQLIDINNFSFNINPKPCLAYPAGLFLVIIVASKPTNYGNRKIIRNTWGRSIDSIKVVFLLGEPADKNVAQEIYMESAEYGDIVQGNFVDAYRNMTYKHVMGLKWVSHHCPLAKYILKTDDDVVINTHMLKYFLTRQLSPWGAKGLITCQVLKNAQVQRTNQSKWRVSTTEYAGHHYPTYCAGWAILYSQDVVPRLLTVAQKLPYFWIDDVHITGVCAQRIGVTRTPLGSLCLNFHRSKLLTNFGAKSAGVFLFGPHDLTVDKIKTIWNAIPE